MRYIKSLSLCAVATLIPAMGCGKAAEVTQEKMIEASLAGEGVDANVDISADGGAMNLSATTEDGKVSFSAGENVSLPEGFPTDIPIPQGWKVNLVNTEAQSELFNVVATVPKPFAEVSEFFKKEVAAKGWQEVSTTNVPGMMLAAEYSKDGRTLNVVVNASDGPESTVSLSTMRGE
ncbi:MAG: hypothetical protein RLZZ303_2043 [Candidatus Hydrogenedentota bacterium]